MTKDRDRDLVERINSALTEDIQQMLEKVFIAKLKPLTQTLEILKKGQQDLMRGQEALETKFDKVEKEQKKQSKTIKKVQSTLDLALRMLNKEDMQFYKRMKRIEDHLNLSRFE